MRAGGGLQSAMPDDGPNGGHEREPEGGSNDKSGPEGFPSDEEIEKRLRRAAGVPEPDDDELERRLRELGVLGDDADEADPLAERIKAIKEPAGTAASRLPEVPDWEFNRPKLPGQRDPEKGDAYLGVGVGLSVAYTLIGAILVGFGIGWLIDRSSHGYIGQALGTLLGAIAGIAGAVFTIVRAQKGRS